jgi:hypothetical protein
VSPAVRREAVDPLEFVKRVVGELPWISCRICRLPWPDGPCETGSPLPLPRCLWLSGGSSSGLPPSAALLDGATLLLEEALGCVLAGTESTEARPLILDRPPSAVRA